MAVNDNKTAADVDRTAKLVYEDGTCSFFSLRVSLFMVPPSVHLHPSLFKSFSLVTFLGRADLSDGLSRCKWHLVGISSYVSL